MPSGPPPQARREAVLVGYGVREAAVTRRPRRRPPAGPGVGRAHRPTGPSPGVGPSPRYASWPRTSASTWRTSRRPGPTGPSPATTSSPDVPCQTSSGALAHVSSDSAGRRARGEVVLAASIDGERREPVRGIRKHMAEAMVRSAFTIPHVTVWAEVDVSRSVRMTRRLRETPGFNDVRVSPLLLVARAVLLGIKRNPDLNAVFDADAQEVVYRDQVNLGIAAATPRGLVVPNIKDAGRLSLPELAAALDALGPYGSRGAHRPRQTWLEGRSPSPTSGCSASTVGRRSSIPARLRSSRSARSASGPGSTRAASSRAGSPSSRCRSTTGTSTARWAHASCRTWQSVLEDPAVAVSWS